MEKNEKLKGGFEILFLGLQLTKPDITKEQAENAIIQIGNYLQIKRLEKNK